MNFSDLDHLIDVAAAEMTKGVPSSGFRDRVMANLNRTPKAGWSRFAPGIAAAAAVALLAFWLPRYGNLGTPSIPDVPQGPSAPIRNQMIGQALSPGAPAGSRQRRTSTAPRICADEAAWLARAVPPLPASPAIVIDGIQPERPTIAPISVEPLVAGPIEVTPLVIPSTTNGGR